MVSSNEEIVQNSINYNMMGNMMNGSNMLSNIVYSVIVMSLITFCTNNLSIYINNVLNFIRFKLDSLYSVNTVSFECTETKCYYAGTRMNCSENFRAILYHIKEKVKTGNTKNLQKIIEFHKKKNFDGEIIDDKVKDILYLIDQENDFYLLGEGEINIVFNMKCTEEIKNDEKTDGKIYTLKLISKSEEVKIKEIQNYITQIKKKYYDKIEEQINNNQYVFQYEGVDADNNNIFKMYPFYTTCSLDKIWFDDKEELLNRLDKFINNKKWYEDKGRAHTLGIGCVGIPGTGKTSLTKSLTKKLNRHLIIVDISKIPSQKHADEIFFDEYINDIKIPYDKRIYSVPDIDAMKPSVTGKRKQNKKNDSDTMPIESKDEVIKLKLKMMSEMVSNMNDSEPIGNSLNLSKILNILDGIPERTGQIFIMETNHPEKLDPALLRPGRIDQMINFKRMSRENSIKLILNYFNETDEFIIDKKKIPDRKYTPAEIFQICSRFDDIIDALNKIITI